jgi:hypothetical protein
MRLKLCRQPVPPRSFVRVNQITNLYSRFIQLEELGRSQLAQEAAANERFLGPVLRPLVLSGLLAPGEKLRALTICIPMEA